MKKEKTVIERDKIYGCSKICNNEANNLIINLHKKLGYVNKCCIDEIKRLINKYKNTFVDNIKAFSQDLYPIINDALNVLSQIASSIKDKHDDQSYSHVPNHNKSI